MSEMQVRRFEDEVSQLPDMGTVEGVDSPEGTGEIKSDLEKASEVFRLVEDLGGDTDIAMAGLIVDANGHAENSPGDSAAKIADAAGAYKILKGGDVDDTARTLGKQPHKPLAEALAEIAEADLSGEAVQIITEAIDGAERDKVPGIENFVTEVLHKDPEVIDTYDRKRPSYEIAGRTVVFRNRMEIVEIPNNPTVAVAAETVQPLDIATLPHPEQYPYDQLKEFNQQHSVDVPGATLSIPNTPLGIAEAAVMLGSEGAVGLRDKLRQGQYTDKECSDFMDSVLGLASIDDKGDPLEAFETDSYAVALSGLTGNAEALAMMRMRGERVRELEETRKEHNKQGALDERDRRHGFGHVENPLPLEKMFAIHSTPHELEFDEAGNAVFRPAGQYESTAIVPRASWHVTINSGVFPHAQAAESWGSRNRLVIAPLNEVMRETPDRLEVLDGVDTWFVMNPGEEIKVPRPTIIEATVDSEDLIKRNGNTVQFLWKEQYSPEEQEKIAELAVQYGAADIDSMKGQDIVGADTLKEACLQMVLAEQGVQRDERDRPSFEGHGMTDRSLGQRIYDTALDLGCRSGTHFNKYEAQLELQGYGQMRYNLAQKLADKRVYPFVMGTALGARRQALVNGGMPAAPQLVPPPIIFGPL